MKSVNGSRTTHRIGEASKRPDESQVVVLQGAPCRNRTYNLMIKSHGKAPSSARTGSAQPFPAPLNVAALVPQENPIAARSSRISSTPFSIPDPFADEKIWMVYGAWV